MFAHEMFLDGFAKEFGWHYTDVPFVWDGKKVTIYRAIEEHVHNFFEFVDMRLRENPHFVSEVAEKVVREVYELQPFLESITPEHLQKASSQDLMTMMDTLHQSVLTVTPWFLILMYFPQQLERLGLGTYKKDFDIAVEARGKVDKILGPLSNKATLLLCAEALRRHTLSESLAHFMVLYEFESLISETPSRDQIRNLQTSLQNREGYWMVAGHSISTEPVETYIARHGWELQIPDISQEVTELHGKSVYISGPIEGTVRIITNQREIHKVQEGDIVVAPMTTPEYAPIFPKIQAIITDEGGVTCHAAVVSREMKIPAIVGTKIASSILKDGDRVLVDTKQGIVRLL